MGIPSDPRKHPKKPATQKLPIKGKTDERKGFMIYYI